MPKKVLIALPPSMLEVIDGIARDEHRTRSDLIRESLRRYIHEYRRNTGATVAYPVQPSTSAMDQRRSWHEVTGAQPEVRTTAGIS